MNKIIVSGHITRDIEVRTTKNGKPVSDFGIAVNRITKTDGKYDVDFFNCTAFGASAEYVGNYLAKGSKVLVVGRLENNNYEKDGVKHYGDKIFVENVEGLDKKKAVEQKEGFEGMGAEVKDEEVPEF